MNAQSQGFIRTDSDFLSRGTKCRGWLYRPKGTEHPPVVIMAHGFAAEKTFRLPAYAERFAAAGIAVYVFDYRCFGDSDGQPRNLVSPSRHLQDWKAALAHVRSLPEVDSHRIALWGSSFSGGHVIVTAAQDPDIKAITAQVPYVDSLSSRGKMELKQTMRGLVAACRDIFRLLTFRSPYYIPVVGDPGTLAVMNAPDSKPGYFSIVPQGSSWKNECPARIFFAVPFYRPITVARKVNCPALIIMAEKDSIIWPGIVEKAAARMPNARLIRMPVGHFDVYTGDWFEKTVQVEADFLKEHLM
ncbi:MAG: alpha/beta hydrolase [Chloroflexi bacterium]|nr:alpha/beta hydrolase [Chloroflexota bacterium]